MSTSRSILFFAEKKSPMIKFIHKSIKEIHKGLYPDYPPHVIKRGQYKGHQASEAYASMWVFPDGEDLEYFGGEDVFGNRFDKYNKKYKLWVCMGGSNTTYHDRELGIKSVYPIYYFRLLMERIKASGIENDVFLTCTTQEEKSYPPRIRKQWTGKFL